MIRLVRTAAIRLGGCRMNEQITQRIRTVENEEDVPVATLRRTRHFRFWLTTGIDTMY